MVSRRRTTKRRRRAKDVIHAVPDGLAVLGLSPIVAESTLQGWESPLEYFMQGDLKNGVTVLQANVKNKDTLKEVVVMEGIALGAKILGRKLGLNRIGTRKLKLF